MNTLEFAKYELDKYSLQMGIKVNFDFVVDYTLFDTAKFFMFDPMFDDAFSIEFNGESGVIKATNERSILFGVYHFLKCQGCQFLHPEDGGEYIPYTQKTVPVSETWYAKLRHRGTTDSSCGGVSKAPEIYLKYIDFLPKIMANSYMTELTDYYSHIQGILKYPSNPFRESDEYERESFDKYEKILTEEIKKRSLIRHGAGHGWTIEVLGMDELHRGQTDAPCRHPEMIALINGERKYYDKRPMFTNLCYSQKSVRQAFANCVYEYILKHPEIDLLHVWLADFFSNFCECEECMKKTPTDWYVMLLNDIDELLTSKGCKQKIVFLIYFELAYPPIYERLKNKERFVMMFAPYGRNFRKRYSEVIPAKYEQLEHNKFSYTLMREDIYLSQLKDWKELFDGDSFVFDYNLYEPPIYLDLSSVEHTKLIYDDSLFIKKLGLNGKIECNSISVMTPTAITYHANFMPLFYGDIGFDKIVDDYAKGAYEGNEYVKQALYDLAKLIPHEYMNNWSLFIRRNMTSSEKEGTIKAVELVKNLKKELVNNISKERSKRLNAYYLNEYLDIAKLILESMLEKDTVVIDNPTSDKFDYRIDFANETFKEEITEEAQKIKDKNLAKFKNLVYYKEGIMPGIFACVLFYLYLQRLF